MVADRFFVYSKTHKSREIIDQWASCAVTRSCISPPGSQPLCDVLKIVTGEYAGCHRFDESVFNILLYKCAPQLRKVYRKSDLIEACKEEFCSKSASWIKYRNNLFKKGIFSFVNLGNHNFYFDRINHFLFIWKNNIFENKFLKILLYKKFYNFKLLFFLAYFELWLVREHINWSPHQLSFATRK